MLKYALVLFVAVLITGGLFAVYVMREGEVVTPAGQGIVEIDNQSFEAFPLPDYAASHVSDAYKSYFIEVEPGIKIHVLEIGTGHPVYLQHGNPTSGFLYRKVAAELPKDQVRLIMPTMVGLGFSSKVAVSAHTLDNHLRWMNSVLDTLDLKDIVYVGQDWGGPVGMGALARSPDRLAGVVALNTGFRAPEAAFDLSRVHALAKTPLVGELMLEVFVSVFDRLGEVQGDPASIPPDIAELYGRPVMESGNAKAPLALMRMVADGPDHPSSPALREIEAYVAGLDVPAEIVWGMNDPIIGQGLDVMRGQFPNAPVLETGAGHFLQEEVPEEIAAAIMRVVAQVQAGQPETAPPEAFDDTVIEGPISMDGA